MIATNNCLSPYGFLTGFDTQKRRVYTDRQEEQIVSLKRDGMAIRKIAKELNIPFGSIHYILRKYGEVSLDNSKPGLSWLSRKEAFWQYDMSSKSFDYVKRAYPQYHRKVGNTVFIHIKYIADYYLGKKAHIDREELRRNET